MKSTKKTGVNVLIIHPVIPKYRLFFFEKLLQYDEFNFTILTGKNNPFGASSCTEVTSFAHVIHSNIGFFGNRLLWQRFLKIPTYFTKDDILVISGNPRYLSNIPLCLKARMKGMKIIWWGQGWSGTSTRINFYIRRFIMKRFDRIILYTKKEKKDFLSFGFDEEILFGLNNTINTKSINEICSTWSPLRLDAFKKKHALDSKTVLLFVGRIRQKAELHLAIESLSYLNNRKNILFVIVGDGDYREKIQSYSKKLNVEDNLLFIGQIYNEENLAPWFLSSCCFIYPGSIGLSLLHSFSYGLPVITHDNPKKHMPEYSAFIDKKNGLAFRQYDAKDLATKIESLITNKVLTSKLSINAKNTCKYDFSSDHMVNEFIRAISFNH